MNFYVGYQLNSTFSVEGGYIDFGEASATAVSDGSGSFWWAGPVEAKAEADAITLGIKAALPINDNVSFHGKLGVASWDVDADAIDSWGTVSESDDGNDLYFGIGASYDLGKVSLDASYTQYKDVDIDVMSIGANLKF